MTANSKMSYTENSEAVQKEKKGLINMKRDQTIVVRLIKDEKNLSIGIKKFIETNVEFYKINSLV